MSCMGSKLFGRDEPTTATDVRLIGNGIHGVHLKVSPLALQAYPPVLFGNPPNLVDAAILVAL